MYFLVARVEYPYEKKCDNETVYVTMPGKYIDFEMCGYLEFPMDT